MQREGALYLIPVEIADDTQEMTIPAGNLQIVRNLRVFIVENLRTARRCLRRWDKSFPIDDCTFYELNGHTPAKDIGSFLNNLRNGESTGILSEAGCPAIADPGAQAVAIAQREGLRVIPLVGPSSILLALMGSGFNGQGFTFNGYIPVHENERIKSIKELEQRCLRRNETQIFIETPYRNNRLIELLSKVLHPDTCLCVASDITHPENESIITMPAQKWRNVKKDYDKKPAIFLIGRPNEK